MKHKTSIGVSTTTTGKGETDAGLNISIDPQQVTFISGKDRLEEMRCSKNGNIDIRIARATGSLRGHVVQLPRLIVEIKLTHLHHTLVSERPNT